MYGNQQQEAAGTIGQNTFWWEAETNASGFLVKFGPLLHGLMDSFGDLLVLRMFWDIVILISSCTTSIILSRVLFGPLELKQERPTFLSGTFYHVNQILGSWCSACPITCKEYSSGMLEVLIFRMLEVLILNHQEPGGSFNYSITPIFQGIKKLMRMYRTVEGFPVNSSAWFGLEVPFHEPPRELIRKIPWWCGVWQSTYWL